MVLIPAMTVEGCSESEHEPQIEIPDNMGGDDGSGTVESSKGKILIAYFSRWGNTNYPADVDASTGANIIIGNATEKVLRKSWPNTYGRP